MSSAQTIQLSIRGNASLLRLAPGTGREALLAHLDQRAHCVRVGLVFSGNQGIRKCQKLHVNSSAINLSDACTYYLLTYPLTNLCPWVLHKTGMPPRSQKQPQATQKGAFQSRAQQPPPTTHQEPQSFRQATPTNPVVRLWDQHSRRTRLIVIASIIVVVAFIIGLAAGLSSRNSSQNLPLPSAHGGPYEGDLTYYDPGLGACGVTSANGDKIVAVSHFLFDAVQTGSDPNTNPLCGKKVRVKRLGGDVTVDLTVVDRCVGCETQDLDMTEETFSDLADVALGRVTGEWSWLESVPGGR